MEVSFYLCSMHCGLPQAIFANCWPKRFEPKQCACAQYQLRATDKGCKGIQADNHGQVVMAKGDV